MKHKGLLMPLLLTFVLSLFFVLTGNVQDTFATDNKYWATTYYQATITNSQGNSMIICCVGNYMACLNSKATQQPCPDASGGKCDTFSELETFNPAAAIVVRNQCYQESYCFQKLDNPGWDGQDECKLSAPDNCTSNSQCSSTEYCDLTSQPKACFPKKANGKMCTNDDECLYKNCQKPTAGGVGTGFCNSPVCDTWTYSAWSPCVAGEQARTKSNPMPLGCTGGTSEPLIRACGPGTTCTWTYSPWSPATCTAGQKQNRTKYNPQPDGCDQINSPSEPLQQDCVIVPNCETIEYNDWGACVDGQKSRTIKSQTPSGCNPVGATLTQACGAGIVDCTPESFTYSAWSSCVAGKKTRTLVSRNPANCVGDPPGPFQQTCTLTCTAWTYSPWSECGKAPAGITAEPNKQKRTILTSTPQGCTGGASGPLEKGCASAPAATSCTPNPCPKGQYCNGTACVAGVPKGQACAGDFQCAAGFCYNSVCSDALSDDCAALSGDPTGCETQPNCMIGEGTTCVARATYGMACTGSGQGNCSEGECIPFLGKSECRKTCTKHSDCPEGNYCMDTNTAKFCKVREKEGAACNADGDVCISGICESGKCKGNAPPTVDASGGIVKAQSEFELPNFLRVDDPNVVVGRIIKYIIGFAGTIALLTFMYGGTLWLISAGRTDYVTKGKNYMIWSAIGLAIVFGSYVLVSQVLALFGQ